jgi:hypothetical protein
MQFNRLSMEISRSRLQLHALYHLVERYETQLANDILKELDHVLRKFQEHTATMYLRVLYRHKDRLPKSLRAKLLFYFNSRGGLLRSRL